MTDKHRTDEEAYAQFVDYTCYLTVQPFADYSMEVLGAFVSFFETWLDMADQRLEDSK